MDMLTELARWFCTSKIGSYACISQDKIADQITGAVVAALLGAIVSTFGSLLSLFKAKFWQISGRWYRYGVGFYPNEGRLPIHKARVFILSLPPLVFIISYNKSYSYLGSLRWTGGNMYITWRGITHSERMMSVYSDPLIMNRDTVLIGVKSCITKNSEPAANKEILTRRAMLDEEILSLVGRGQSRIVVRNAQSTPAHYEGQPRV